MLLGVKLWSFVNLLVYVFMCLFMFIISYG